MHERFKGWNRGWNYTYRTGWTLSIFTEDWRDFEYRVPFNPELTLRSVKGCITFTRALAQGLIIQAPALFWPERRSDNGSPCKRKSAPLQLTRVESNRIAVSFPSKQRGEIKYCLFGSLFVKGFLVFTRLSYRAALPLLRDSFVGWILNQLRTSHLFLNFDGESWIKRGSIATFQTLSCVFFCFTWKTNVLYCS